MYFILKGANFADSKLGKITVVEGQIGTGGTTIDPNAEYTLTIQPTPSDATVTLTAAGYTQSGNSIKVKRGTQVTIKLEKTGYVSQTFTKTVYGDSTATYEIYAESVKTYTLTINPNPANAIVTLNGAETKSITVPEGQSVTWVVSASGYTTQTDVWLATKNETLNITLAEKATEVKTFNLTWEPGSIDTNHGGTGSNSNRRRTVDFIPIEYGFAYLTSVPGDTIIHVIFYDANKNYLAPTSTSTTEGVNAIADNWFNLLQYKPDGAEYFKIMARTGDVTQDTYWKPLQNVMTTDMSNVTWEAGGINITNGKNASDQTSMTNRRRTISYLPASYKYVTVSDNIDVHVLYYDNQVNYLGSTKTGGSYVPITLNAGQKTNVCGQAPTGTVYYRLLARTGDTTQDQYYSFSTE